VSHKVHLYLHNLPCAIRWVCKSYRTYILLVYHYYYVHQHMCCLAGTFNCL